MKKVVAILGICLMLLLSLVPSNILAKDNNNEGTLISKLSGQIHTRKENNLLEGAMPCRGDLSLLVLNVHLNDSENEMSSNELRNLFFGNHYTGGSSEVDQNLWSYFRTTSYGNLNVNGDVQDVYIDSFDELSYQNISNFFEKVFGSDDLSIYDMNNDHYIDGVAIVYPDGYEYLANGSAMSAQLTFGDYTLAHYIVLGERGRNVSTLAHEMVHTMGVPDIYAGVGVNLSGTYADCLMDGAQGGWSPDMGTRTSDVPGVLKYLFGWYDSVQEIYEGTGTTYTVQAGYLGATAAFIYPNQNTDSDFVYFVEYLRPEDHPVSANYEYFGDGGLRIWKVKFSLDDNYNIDGNDTAIGMGFSPFIYLEALHKGEDKYLFKPNEYLSPYTPIALTYSNTYEQKTYVDANGNTYTNAPCGADFYYSGIHMSKLKLQDEFASFKVEYHDEYEVPEMDYVVKADFGNYYIIGFKPVEGATGYDICRQYASDTYNQYIEIETLNADETYYVDTWDSASYDFIFTVKARFESDETGTVISGYGVGIDTSTINKDPIHMTAFDLNKSRVDIGIGDTASLVGTFEPRNTTNKRDITWTSADSTIATVVNGVVTGVSYGQVEVTASLENGMSATCLVNVCNPITELELDTTSLILAPSDSQQLQATILPEDTTSDKTLTWKSSDESVAVVNNGLVTAVGLGPCEVTVTASNGVKAVCDVYVTDQVCEFELSDTYVYLESNATHQLQASVLPASLNASTELTFTSTKPSVATVNQNGLITAVNAGETEIIIALKDGSLSTTCYVEVAMGAPLPKATRASSSSIKVSWNKVAGANGYEVYRSTSYDGTYAKVKTITKGTTLSWTDTDKTYGKEYYYKMRAYRTVNGKKQYSKFSDIAGMAIMNAPTVSVKQTDIYTTVLSWKAVSKAEIYEVHQSVDGNEYTNLGFYASLSEVFNQEPYVTYTYKVRAAKGIDTGVVYGPFSSVVSLKTVLSKPTMTINNTDYVDGLYLEWNEVVGANGYEVHRATKLDGTYSVVCSDSILNYVDTNIEMNKNYFYKVRPYLYDSNGEVKYGPYSTVQASALVSTPVVKTTQSASTSIKVSWAKISGTSGYEVYRSTTFDGAYSKVKTITKGTTLSWTDEKKTVGKEYYYKVRAYRTVNSKKVYSQYSDVVAAVVLKKPTLTVKAFDYDTALLSWKAIAYADAYKVYRSTDNKTFTEIDMTSNVSTYAYELIPTLTYYFKVRPVKYTNMGEAYGMYSTVQSVKTNLAKPTITVEPNVEDVSISISGSYINGADGYRLYRATSKDGTYTMILDQDNPYFVDTNVQVSKSYFYKVLAYRGVGDGVTIKGPYSTIQATAILTTPTVTVKQSATTSLKVSWNKVSGASGYVVYRSTNYDGSYSKVKTITKGTTLSWTDEKKTSGQTYCYKVLAYKTVNGKKVYSNASDIVEAVVMKVTSVKAKAINHNQIELTWNEIEQASQYAVYRSTKSTSGFEKIADAIDTSFVDSTIDTNKTYYYKVSALAGTTYGMFEGKLSAYASCKAIVVAPTIQVANATYNSITLQWDEIEGVDRYEIYRSTKKDGTYTMIESAEYLSEFTDSTVVLGKTYYYRIKAIAMQNNGTEVKSAFSNIVSKKVVLTTPTLNILNDEFGVLVAEWTSVDGSDGYELYRATSKTGTYTKVFSEDGIEYRDSNVKKDKTYYYKVRAYRLVDGVKKYSSYSTIKSAKVK